MKSATGQRIYGTNSKILKQTLGMNKAKTNIQCTWTFPNILSSGDYTIDLAITHSDGVTQADWWNEAIEFHIDNPHNTSHVVSPVITQKIELR